ncbi:meiotic recombination protein SPO11-2-like [Durio zibethinus]|uniref:Meiotic recombination protein SPO11-2-like n=1 Tax=Durio zibethinus TaxID=66656 RepID=A0A6P5ZNZ7_DURZI|nr:meiotic recombination protein SPO11-2-like [Durio zibethinus]
MEICFEILIQKKRVTQRELFYKLLCDSPDYFSSQLQEIGIMASSRGLVAGPFLLQALQFHQSCLGKEFIKFHRPLASFEPNQEAVDFSACESSVFEFLNHSCLYKTFYSDFLMMFVSSNKSYLSSPCDDIRHDSVLKHAIFQRLVEDRAFNQDPSILLTAKGYPDIPTRFLLHQMSRAFPDLPILALVDWYGSPVSSRISYIVYLQVSKLREGPRACNVTWLGLRGDDLQLIPDQSLAPVKPRDLQIAKSLISSEIMQENNREELALMMQNGQIVDFEALYFHGYDYLVIISSMPVVVHATLITLNK